MFAKEAWGNQFVKGVDESSVSEFAAIAFVESG